MEIGHDQVVYSHHFAKGTASDKHATHEVCDVLLDRIKSALPYFEGKYDPNAYIEWELNVDNEFKKYDLSEKQKVRVASSVLIKCALTEWKHLCRFGKDPQSWKDVKRHFRDVFVPEYYSRILFTKLQCMKQETKNVAEYLAKLKLCLLRCGLEETDELLESRFLQGLNVEIQSILVDKHYNSFDELFDLACDSEIKLKKDLTNATEARVSPITNNLQQIDVNIQMRSKEFEILDETFEEKENSAAPLRFEKSIKGKSNDRSMNKGEHALREPHLSTNRAIIEQSIVEPVTDFSLSHINMLVVPCDKDELCNNASLISIPELVNTAKIFESMSAEFKHVVHIANENEESQLLSSLHTIGYIEFDDLCELSCLENNLFVGSELPCSYNVSFHAIGKYNCKEEYMVRRIYICSNLKSPFIMQKYDQLVLCNSYNHAISSSPSFIVKKQDKSQEGEHGSVLPTTCPPTMVKPRTVCCQEGENDEDIIGSDMTMLTTCKPKVQPFYMRLIIDTFDELVLHHKMCMFSFSELLTWIKGRFDFICKAWKVNEVDWGLSPSIPNVLNQATTSLLAKETKSPSPTRFGCWIRTAEQHQLVMAATTSYGLRFGRANTFWKAYQVYFLMDPASCPYQLGFGRNRRFNTETFSVYGAASPCFGPMAHVSSWVH